VASRRGGTAYPPVLTGDFNAEPDADEMRLIGGHKTAPLVPGQVLHDVWRFADPLLPSGTWDVTGSDTPGIYQTNTRIDYILVGLPGPGGSARSVPYGARVMPGSGESGRRTTQRS
jgi:endonuclease/exonuclease/phosphatase family metal-dependent hydrolase